MRLAGKVFVLGCLILAACNVRSADFAHKEAPPSAEATRAGAPAGGGGEASSAVATSKPDPARVIIYTAEVQIYVDSVAETEKKLPELVEQHGAYISDSSVSHYGGGRRQAKWTMRVPVEKYQGLLKAIGGLGAVESASSKADDVTAEYVDVEARLTNLRNVEQRLQGILKQQTGKLSDVLEVEREIARVREDLERAEGRMRFLTNQASLSTITVSVFERAGYEPMPEEPTLKDRIGWAWRESMHGVVEFAKDLVVFLVRLVPWIPVLAGLFVAVFFLVKWRVRRRARRARKTAETAKVSDS